jgi:hypothetical protein
MGLHDDRHAVSRCTQYSHDDATLQIVVDAGHSEGFKEAINTEFKIANGEYAPVDPNMAMIVCASFLGALHRAA